MKNSLSSKLLWISLVVVTACIAGSGQASAPLLQDIKVYSATPGPVATATPLVRKTGAATPSAAPVVVPPTISSVRTMFPALAEVAIPGYSGIIVETLDGRTVIESNPGFMFNPASNVKTGTSYSVLKAFGPEFRFATNVYTDGALDQATGNLIGNIYVSGRDPIFGYEHAVAIAHELNRAGVKT
nr:D-alanyl-D-alanine carboxypeptidase [Blastocatellia bacterium]